MRDHYKTVSEFNFIVSPLGEGLDCYRTWEALLLGSWPIVQSSTINPLYKDLPVLIVSDWSVLSDDLLLKAKMKFEQGQWRWEKLFIPYWRDRFRGK